MKYILIFKKNTCKDFLEFVQYLSSYANIDTINRVISGSDIDLHLDIDSEIRLRGNFTARKNISIFQFVNFPLYVAILAYGVYKSQMIPYFSVCVSYKDFLDRGLLLTRNLQNQVLLVDKLRSSQFNIRCHDLINRYGMYAPLVVAFLVHDVTSEL